MQSRHFHLIIASCFFLFLGLIAIRFNAPWRLVHEDTGAFATSFATAHLKLGLKKTKGHDFQLDNATGQVFPYAHHPPGSNLLLAGVFLITGSRAPAVTRGFHAIFHLLSLVLLIAFFKNAYSEKEVALAAFCLAVVPMSSFFGRVASPDLLTLPAVLVLIWSYLRLNFEESPPRSLWVVLTLSACWGAWMAWPIFFALLACFLHASATWLHTQNSRLLKLLILLALLGIGLFLLNFAYIYWASGAAGMERLATGFQSASGSQDHRPWWQTLGHVLEYCRRYFTEILFFSAFIYLYLLGRRAQRGMPLSLQDHAALLLFFTALMNILVFHNRANNHHYWPYYFLPFMVFAFVETTLYWSLLYPYRSTKIITACIILISVSSAITLYKRHTRESGYAIRTVEMLQRFY